MQDYEQLDEKHWSQKPLYQFAFYATGLTVLVLNAVAISKFNEKNETFKAPEKGLLVLDGFGIVFSVVAIAAKCCSSADTTSRARIHFGSIQSLAGLSQFILALTVLPNSEQKATATLGIVVSLLLAATGVASVCEERAKASYSPVPGSGL